MKRAIFAAATAGLGALGTAGLMAAAPAQAACDDAPIPIGERANCLVSQDIAGFAQSVDPFYNAQVFLNGNEDDPELGVLDWPKTFADSVADFANGPRSAGGPSPADTSPPGSGGEE